MALQFIFGASGAGKSHYIYSRIIRESMEHPRETYLILVPEQFTMQTQKELVTMHPRKGIMNIDVLSFERLAFRVLEEVGASCSGLLEETGKSMVLRKVAQEKKKELKILGNKMDRQGYVSQMKSMVSELRQYEIMPEDLEEIRQELKDRPELYYKMQDIQTLYQGFFAYLEGKFITQEEVLDVMGDLVHRSEKLKGSTLVLDGYTGFTPVQLKALGKLLSVCADVFVTVTLAPGEDPYQLGSPHRLFYLSKQTVHRLCKLAKETGISWEEYWITEKEQQRQGRFAQNPPLAYLEKHIFRYGSRPYTRLSKDPAEGEKGRHQHSVFIQACLNPGEEMEEIAARIRSLVRREGYRYRDFAVITGDMEVYAPAAGRAFAKYGIPCFLDQKQSLLLNPFVEYIRASVDMAVENFSYESVFRMLRCGLADVEEEALDRLENYVIAKGIRGVAKWQEEWVRSYRGEDPQEVVELNQVKAGLLENWLPFAQAMKTKDASVRDYARALYEYIAGGRIQEKLKQLEKQFAWEGDLSRQKEYSQIYPLVMDLLDKLVDILGEEKVSIREFKEILDAGLSEARVGIVPPAPDQVLVGDMERTRLKDIRILFFAGVNEGKIPKEEKAGKILSDLNREELEKPLQERGLSLAPTAKEALYTQKFYLYMNLTKPRDRIYLTYSRLSGSGEALSPSYLIAQTERLFPDAAVRERELLAESPEAALEYLSLNLRADTEEDPVYAEVFTWFKKQEKWKEVLDSLIGAAFYANPHEQITKETAAALYGTELKNSATRLEEFAKCACAHFLSYGLALRERVKYEFSMADLGTLLHGSLDLFAKKIREQGKPWAELTDEERDTLAEQCVEEVVEKSGQQILSSSARNAYTIRRAKRMVKKSAWALQYQLRQGEFLPALTEWAFGFADDFASVNLQLSEYERIHLMGRIDRIDTYQEQDQLYVKVIDYKSGQTELDLTKLYYGIQLQLALYLNAAVELEQKRFPAKKVKPAGIFYYQIKDPVLNQEEISDQDHPEKDILKKLRMDGIAPAEPGILTKLDRDLAQGKGVQSLAVPVKYTAKGTFAAGSKVADEEQFQSLMRYANHKAKEIGRQILDGKAEASPYEKQKETACQYCPYRTVCGFDEKIPGYAYRRLLDRKPEEIWQKMREALDEEQKEE